MVAHLPKHPHREAQSNGDNYCYSVTRTKSKFKTWLIVYNMSFSYANYLLGIVVRHPLHAAANPKRKHSRNGQHHVGDGSISHGGWGADHIAVLFRE